MKRILFLTLLVFSFSLLTPAQSRTNRLYRPCSGSTTPATVAIDVAGNITATPCSGKTVIINRVKVYRALLTQSGTSAPTATVLENSLGGTVVWARTGTGAYTATLTGAFPASKVFAKPIVFQNLSDVFLQVMFTRSSDNVIAVSSVDIPGITSTDLEFTELAVEILVYP